MEGKDREPSAPVRPDHATKEGEHEARLHGGTDARPRAEALRGEARHLSENIKPLHPGGRV